MPFIKQCAVLLLNYMPMSKRYALVKIMCCLYNNLLLSKQCAVKETISCYLNNVLFCCLCNYMCWCQNNVLNNQPVTGTLFEVVTHCLFGQNIVCNVRTVTVRCLWWLVSANYLYDSTWFVWQKFFHIATHCV